MRVSDSAINRDFVRNLSTNMNKAQQYQNQLSSLKEVSKSSDNPLLVAKIIHLNDNIMQNKNYSSTIKDGLSFSQTQDSALASVTNSFQKIRDLIQSSANSTQGEDELLANKNAMTAEIEGIVDALNTNYDGRYIFSGKKDQVAPFAVVRDASGTITGLTYSGTTSENQANQTREIAKGVNVDLITDGRLFMNEKGTAENPNNLSTFFGDLITAVNSGDKKALSGELLSKVDIFKDNVVNVRANIGTIYNRLEAAQDRNETESISLKEDLSNKQDIDLAGKYMEYSNQMLAYQASLSMGTKIMQTSILNYV